MTTRNQLIVVAMLLVLASAYLNLGRMAAATLPPRESLERFPTEIGSWKTSEDTKYTGELLKNLGVDEYVMRHYDDGNGGVWLYIGYYRDQREGAVPHSPRHCYPGSGWIALRNGVAPVPTSPAGTDTFLPNWYVFQKGEEKELVVYWYQSRGRSVANEYWDKIYLVRDEILEGRSDGSLVRCSTGIREGDEEEARKRLGAFISVLYPLLPRYIPN